MLTRLPLVLLICLTLSCTLLAEDWPQWLGPERDGVCREIGLLKDWPNDGPEQVWLFKDCGVGYSGPAVVGDVLYIMGARNSKEQLIALDAATGKELWATDLGEVYENDWGNGPRGTPTISGSIIYALSAKGNLVAVNLADGKEKWRVSLTSLGGKIPTWGYAESPLVHEDQVIVTPGGEQGAVAAFDKETGKLRWQSSEVTDGAHYSSVVVALLHGTTQYVQLMAERLISINPDNGKLLWEVPWGGRVAVIPTPIVEGNQIYVTSGYGVGSMLVEIDANNQPSVVYENKIMKNHHGGVIHFGDKLYGHSDKSGWTCQEWATGERVWRERSALGKGAISYAEDRFYCLSEDEGEVVLIAASPDGWQEHGRFTLSPQTELRKPKGKIWMHPVISGGKMYLRDQDLLFAFDIKAPN